MPRHASFDAITEPPRPVECRFELLARRLTERWLCDGHVSASADDLAVASVFLKRCGFTAEILPGLHVRLVSPNGRAVVTTREDVVVTAVRCLATRDAERTAAAPATACAA